MTSASTAAAATAYGRFWAELSPATTIDLLALADPAMRFKDPFNDFRGADRVVAMLDHMFQNTEAPRFVVAHTAVADDTAFYRWDFTCRLRRPRTALDLAGVSEVRFGPDSRVVEHIDHWDAASQVYARIPVLGAVLRLLARRLAFEP